jgi:predicted DNA-binding WGR domain protein
MDTHMLNAEDIADKPSTLAFPSEVALTRIRPERNEWRFYRLAVWPGLFGDMLLARHWGRIGTPGRLRLDSHPDATAAAMALEALADCKRRRGYREHATSPPVIGGQSG